MGRVFVVDGREYPDPDPNSSTNDVKEMLATFMPELATADVRESKRGEDTVYQFQKRVGTKG